MAQDDKGTIAVTQDVRENRSEPVRQQPQVQQQAEDQFEGWELEILKKPIKDRSWYRKPQPQ